MASNDSMGVAASGAADPALVSYTHVIYALHSLSVLVGLTSAVTVVGSFIFGLPSIVAVIMNYVRQAEARGTYLGYRRSELAFKELDGEGHREEKS